MTYYVLKGIYYLLKGIGLLFFKLSEGLYNLVSGGKWTKDQPQNNIPKTNIEVNNTVLYCGECGKRLSEKMINKMFSDSIVYCVYCGKALKVVEYQTPLVSNH